MVTITMAAMMIMVVGDCYCDYDASCIMTQTLNASAGVVAITMIAMLMLVVMVMIMVMVMLKLLLHMRNNTHKPRGCVFKVMMCIPLLSVRAHGPRIGFQPHGMVVMMVHMSKLTTKYKW